MEREDFKPPVVRIAEKFVRWRDEQSISRVERLSKRNYDTNLALAHIAASWAAYSGFASEVYYDLQHPQEQNERDKDN